MSLLRLKNISLAYGADPLLDDVELSIDKGERLCLIGRNGAGKSTLMKLIEGEIQADDGRVERAQGLKVARLIQEVPQDTNGKIYDIVAQGLGDLGQLLADYAHISARLGAGDEQALDQLTKVQHEIDARGAWEVSQQVDTILSRLQLDGEQEFASLSGGRKRRVLLAQALVQQPDILLLDEPTNHLDIDSIRWLEEFLLQYNATLLFITHDRAFLRSLATRIIELDRGKLTSWPGSYDKYLTGKQAALDAEEKANAEFDKKLAQEETWIRQGIKARRTRNEGRVRALKALREERRARRERTGTASLNMQQSDKSGKIVLEANDIRYAWDGQSLVDGFSTTMMRGDRVGIIGPNGCGKSTLLKLLLGQLTPDTGTVKHGTRLEIAYFDQLRDTLDENKTVADNIGEGRDTLTINDQPRHVLSYLQDFLFSPARARQPVKALSGGERNRLLLAKLFTRPFNMLVLDEPTNDLDAETLELLEEQLMNFPGTLLLVSHDREFLNNVVTSSIVFENGKINEYVGGYDDWLRQKADTAPAPANTKKATGTAKKSPPKTKNKKLSYKDQRELDALPGTIEKLETAIGEIQEQMAEPAFYQSDADTISRTTDQLESLEAELEHAYTRWEALEELQNQT